MGKYVMYSSLPMILTSNSAATSRNTKKERGCREVKVGE